MGAAWPRFAIIVIGPVRAAKGLRVRMIPAGMAVASTMTAATIVRLMC